MAKATKKTNAAAGRSNVELDLDLKHPTYEASQPVRAVAHDLYEGSACVKDKGAEYLVRTPNETQQQFDSRLRRAVYENWGACVIESRLSMLLAKPPVHEGFTAEFKEYLEDVDGHGTDAVSFFKRVMERASVEGLAWVLVDKTVPEGEADAPAVPQGGPQPVATKAQEKALGIRPVLVFLDADSVFSWHVGRDKKLTWAVVAGERCTDNGPGIPPTVEQTRTVWTRDTWTLYVMVEGSDKAGEKKPQWNMVGDGPNPTGVVPLVAFYGIKREEYWGQSVIKDILGHILSIYNKFSDRDWFESITNNPVPYVIGETNPNMVEIGGGKGVFLSSANGKQCALGYLEPTGIGADSSRTSEQDLIRRIFEITSRQARKAGAQVQSGEGLKEENEIFNASLSSIAVTTEQGERRCWELMRRWETGDADATLEPLKVEYTKEFKNDDIDSAMLQAFSLMVEKDQLSRETLWDRMKLAGLLPPDFDAKKEKTAIEDDINSTGMPGFDPAAKGTPPAEDEGEDEETDGTPPAPAAPPNPQPPPQPPPNAE